METQIVDGSNEDNGVYQEQQFFESIEGSMPDPDCDYEQLSPLRDQDRFLPIANVSKIMKKAIPQTGKIAKDAKECVQECVSEYISFITSEAAERCQQEKRKTINGEDIIFAMTSLGFDNYIESLKVFLAKYREANKIDLSGMEDGSALDELGTVSGPIFGTNGSVGSTNGNGGGQVATGAQAAGAVAEVYATFVEAGAGGVVHQVSLVNGNQQTCDSPSL